MKHMDPLYEDLRNVAAPSETIFLNVLEREDVHPFHVDVFKCIRFENLSYEATAEKLNSSPKRVKSSFVSSMISIDMWMNRQKNETQ